MEKFAHPHLKGASQATEAERIGFKIRRCLVKISFYACVLVTTPPLSAPYANAGFCARFLSKLWPAKTQAAGITEINLEKTRAFLAEHRRMALAGLNPYSRKILALFPARYASTLDLVEIHNASVFHAYEYEGDGFTARLRVRRKDDAAIYEIVDVSVESVAKTGETAQGLNTKFTRFIATLYTGVEKLVSENPELRAVEIRAGPVVNRRLKTILMKLGFEKTSEIEITPTYVPPSMSAMDSPAYFRLTLTVDRHLLK